MTERTEKSRYQVRAAMQQYPELVHIVPLVGHGYLALQDSSGRIHPEEKSFNGAKIHTVEDRRLLVLNDSHLIEDLKKKVSGNKSLESLLHKGVKNLTIKINEATLGDLQWT